MIFVPDPPQIEGIRHLVANSFAGLLWDPGVGKTITVLEAFQILKEERLATRLLVTSSVNVVDDVWPTEIEKFDDLDLTYAHLRGGEDKRRMGFEMDADVYLINNENLYWFFENYGRHLKSLGVDMLCVDESSKFRNGRVRRKKKRVRSAYWALSQMLGQFRRRVILTGTPMPKNYLNFWPQMYLCDRGAALGDTITKFRNTYFYQTEGWKWRREWVLKEGARGRIQEAIAPRMHRAEHSNKVELKFVRRTFRLPPKARAAYDELEREFITEYEGKVLIAKNAAIATTKLRQAANGAVYYNREHDWVAVHERKVQELSDLIDELQGAPLLVALEFEHDYEMMRRFGLEVARYGGSRTEKNTLKEAWNRQEIPVLAAHIDSISHGMNFQYGGCFAACYGLTFNLDAFEQFYKRIWRRGQRSAVAVYLLTAEDTIEDVQLEVLTSRAADQKDFLSSMKNRYKGIKVR